jgi:hypothetical protein
MATYYVRPDGNNGNTGTGSGTGQAWATVAYALANAALPDATNTIYIAPGTYRGTVTLSITPSVSNTLVVAGDPTAAQFTGVTAGRVRITTFTTDNTGTPTSSQTLTCDNKTYFTLRNLHIEGYQTTNGTGIAHFLNSKNYTVEKCLFTHYRRASGASCVFVTTTTTTAINATFDKCVIFNGYAGLNIVSPATGSTFDLGVTVKDTIITLTNNAVIISNPSEGAGVGNGVTFYNCILQGSATLYLRTTNTTNKTLFYNNAIVAFAGIGLDASSNAVTEDYNRFSCTTDRSGPAAGSNSQSGVFGSDFDYSRITGLYALDFWASYNGSIAQNTGTLSGAPTVDIFGDAWSSTNPDVGSATFKIASSVGAYNPSERNASTITIAPGSTSQSIELYLGATGLTYATSGLAAYYVRNQSAPVAITLVTQTATGAWSSGGFAEISSSLVPGVYRLDVPNAAFAAGASDVTIVVRGASGTNGAVLTVTLSSGGLTAAQTAAAIFNAATTDYTANGTYGLNLLRADQQNKQGLVTLHSSGGINRVDADVHAIQNDAAAATYLKGALLHDGTGYVDADVVRVSTSIAAANELEGALLHNGTDYISADLLTPVSAATSVHIGPYQLLADGLGADQPLDVNVGTATSIDVQVTDANGTGIDITGATTSAKVYNAGGTLVATYSGTATYADNGRLTFGLTTTVTNTSGTYTVTVTRTTGATDTQIFGPLRLYVRPV